MTDENATTTKAHRHAARHLGRFSRVREEIQALVAVHAPDTSQAPAGGVTAPPTEGTK